MAQVIHANRKLDKRKTITIVNAIRREKERTFSKLLFEYWNAVVAHSFTCLLALVIAQKLHI